MAILPASSVEEVDYVVLLAALKALKKGDFSVRLPMNWLGMAGKVADAFNEMVEMNERMASELERLSHVVGTEGKITQRATSSLQRVAFAAWTLAKVCMAHTAMESGRESQARLLE